MTHGGWQGSG
ncbi:hypothetical protein EGM_01425, partial [Macaca fascicularis]